MCKNFDADETFSFSTSRLVRIKDRRLGIPYYVFLIGIVAYIVGWVIVLNKGYLLLADASGLARLQLQRPSDNFRANLEDLEYCRSHANAPYYNTSTMNGFSWYTAECLYQPEEGVVFPPDEVNAMFITTRVSLSNVSFNGNGCDATKVRGCNYLEGAETTYYIPNLEMYTLRIDHSMDVPLFDVSQSATDMTSKGVFGASGQKIDPCDAYPKGQCPSFIGSSDLGDIYSIQTLLDATEVYNLDSILDMDSANRTHVPPTAEPRRSTGMVIIMDLEYEGVMSLQNPSNPVSFAYHFDVRAVTGSEYKIQYDSNNYFPLHDYTLVDRHGIRVVVRQSGQVGRFAFQQLLLALVSSVALLTVAKTAVEFLAFQILPLKFIYKQYRTIDTVDFSDLTDADRAHFKRHDVINPHPKVGLAKIQDTSSHAGAASVANGGTAPVGSVAGTNTSVQEHKHTTQDGFWGDLQATYQGDWDGAAADGAKDWH